MEKILVPIDFSESTKKILEEVVKISKEMKSKIFLLHVASLDLGFVVGDMGYQYIPELENTGLEEETKELKRIEEELKAKGADVEVYIKQGIPSDTILDAVEELKIDMITMGSHGKGFILGTILGSVSKNVIKNSRVPVLIIPLNKK